MKKTPTWTPIKPKAISGSVLMLNITILLKIVRRGFTFKVQKYKVFNEKMKQNNINSII